jgi:hypothetical protein
MTEQELRNAIEARLRWCSPSMLRCWAWPSERERRAMTDRERTRARMQRIMERVEIENQDADDARIQRLFVEAVQDDDEIMAILVEEIAAELRKPGLH